MTGLKRIKVVADSFEKIEKYYNDLDWKQLERLSNKFGKEERYLNVSSLAGRIYSKIILESELSEDEKWKLLTQVKPTERTIVPYGSTLPESYTEYDRTGPEAYNKETKLEELTDLAGAIQMVNSMDMPVCRDASYAVMKILAKEGYPALELRLFNPKASDYERLFKNDSRGLIGHAVYLVKSQNEAGEIRYGYVGFNPAKYTQPNYKTVAELHAVEFKKEYSQFEVVDFSEVIDKF